MYAISIYGYAIHFCITKCTNKHIYRLFTKVSSIRDYKKEWVNLLTIAYAMANNLNEKQGVLIWDIKTMIYIKKP